MKKCLKKAISGILTASMLFSSVVFVPTSASVAVAATTGAFSTVGGWNETLYAEWADQNPDDTAVKVGYKLSSDVNYTYLSGNDYTYLVRPLNASLGRVDIPGLKAGTYDLEVTSSDGTVYTKTGIEVTANDRSGYAHWKYSEGVGAYNNDGTPKDNAIIVYVTNENKDTVEVPGYEGKTWSYTPSSSSPYTRDGVGVGNILNNNMKLVQEITITDNHPIIFRFIGKVNAPKNLTPYNTKDPILGGAKGDNGNLAITKYARNITIEGIGSDATIDGWGFTFSQSGTCPTEAGKSFEVRNLTFKNYPEDALGFQGDDEIASPIERVWVHNNVFYPGYCANPAESDKKEGDGSCDFKRGQFYTMSYNHYIGCHKTNLLGAGASDNQYYMTLHHNWYEKVGSRQPLMAGGNVHIYNTYFQGATDTTVDARGSNAVFLENNYYDSCKNYYKSRNNTCIAKSYNETFNSGSIGSISGKRTVATSREQSAIADNGLNFPDGTSMKDFDTNTSQFYYDAANKKSDVQILNATADVPNYVKAHAGVLSVGTDTEDNTEVTTSNSEGSTETTTSSTPVTPSTGDSVKTFENGVDSTYYTIVGSTSNSKGSVSYNGATYSNCLKMESKTNIQFTPKNNGVLTLVFGGTTVAAGKSVKINGTAYKVNDNGIVTVEVAAGTTYTVTKGDSINLFYMAVAEEGGEATTEATTETTTKTVETTTKATTEATTEATTKATTETTTKEPTSETTTEATTETQTPVSGVNIAVDSVNAKVGTQVTIPVRVTDLTSLASLDVNVAFDAGKVTVNSVSNGNVVTDSNAALSYNVANGTVGVAIANPAETIANGDILFNLVVTPTAEGTATFTVTVDEAYATEGKTIEITTIDGTATITKADPVGPTIVKGDADKNGLVEKNDVTTILNYVAGIISSTEIDTEAADVNEDSNVTTRDAYLIQKYLNVGSWN